MSLIIKDIKWHLDKDIELLWNNAYSDDEFWSEGLCEKDEFKLSPSNSVKITPSIEDELMEELDRNDCKLVKFDMDLGMWVDEIGNRVSDDYLKTVREDHERHKHIIKDLEKDS